MICGSARRPLLCALCGCSRAFRKRRPPRYSADKYFEAYRGRSKAEFIAKCGDSLRELDETAYWLELLVEGQIVSADKMEPLRVECDELIAIFVTIIKRARSDS